MDIKKYIWRKLTTDEYSEVSNYISKKREELENIKLECWSDELTLKWWWFKWCNYENNKEAMELVQKLYDLWISKSAMAQNNTEKHKEILCQLIDITDWIIFQDWDWIYMTKDEAKKYVLEYNS